MSTLIFTWMGNTISHHSNPFMYHPTGDGGFHVESDDCSVPASIAMLINWMAEYGSWEVVVDGQTIKRVK